MEMVKAILMQLLQWFSIVGKASVRGYSKFGKYVGNGNADGPFIYTGFRPAFVIKAKRTDCTGYWRMIDNKRNSYNGQYNVLSANATTVQYTVGVMILEILDLLSNGFKLKIHDYDSGKCFNW